MRRTLTLAALVLLGLESVAAAQPETTSVLRRVPPGTLVRVWSSTPSMTKRHAIVVLGEDDTLRLRLGPPRGDTNLLVLPYAEIQRVDRLVPRTRARGALRGFGIGLLAAVAFDAALVGYAGTQNKGNTDLAAALIGILGTPAIVVGGTIIGAVHPGVRWSTEYRR